jgi:hypothetical protein
VNTRRLVWACLALVALSASAVAQSWAGIPQFSADMKVSGRGGENMNGKIYFGGQKTRFDMSGQRGEMIMITDATKKVAYMVMPNEKMYMEMSTAMQGMRGRGPSLPDAKPLDPTNPCSADADMTCQKAGSETVNGRSCDKWEFKSKSDPSKNHTVWIDQKLHFPIKNVGAAGEIWELQNLKEGSQSASLFEVPAGYNKMDMGGMMGRPPKD